MSSDRGVVQQCGPGTRLSRSGNGVTRVELHDNLIASGVQWHYTPATMLPRRL